MKQPIAGVMPTKQKIKAEQASSSTEAVCERLACIHPDASMHGPTPIQHSSLPTTEFHRIDSHPWPSAKDLPYRFHPPQQVRDATCAEYVNPTQAGEVVNGKYSGLGLDTRPYLKARIDTKIDTKKLDLVFGS